jgi:hypothetical protein
MKTIYDLYGAGCPLSNAIGVQVATVPTHHFDAWVLGQPLDHGLGRAIWQQVDDTVGLQIDDNRAIAMAPAPGPLIDADGMKFGWLW